MTRTVWDLSVLSLFLLGMTTFSATRRLPLLAATNAIMMTCIPLLGAPTLSAFGYTTNAGNIFSAVVMYGLGLKYLRYGAEECNRSVYLILFSLVIVFVPILLLQDAEMLSPMFGTRIRIVGASFVAFWLTQSLFIYLLDQSGRIPSLVTVPVIMIAMQVVDSAIFFPCAFQGELSTVDILRFALAGWCMQSLIAILSIPFLAAFLRCEHYLTERDPEHRQNLVVE